MQDNNENISEYLCDLVRKDKAGKNDIDVENINTKIDTILELLTAKNEVKSDSKILKTTITETKIEYLTSDVVNSSNIDKILGIR